MPCQTIYTINALTLLQAYEDSGYAEVLARADVAVADGVGAVWAVRRLTGRRVERVTGLDLIDDLCRICVREGRSVYLLGGRPGVAERAAESLRKRHATLRMAGARNGFWRPEEEQDVVQAVNRTEANLLLVALGQPRQEQFLDRYRQNLTARFAVGVGGSFDVLAGDVRRAPVWMQQAGLEWLFRLLQEPWRIRRVWRLPRFVWLVLRAVAARKIHKL